MVHEILGISPTNDFAYKKVFGSQANELVLISLLNAILKLPRRIAAVTIQNPFNYQDFYEVDQETKRVLKDTIEFHILEMGWYNLQKSDLTKASTLERWLYWLLHAHRHTEEERMSLSQSRNFRKRRRHW